MNNPSISIIVPTYNVAPYIRKCLQSVANQTYKGHIECLVVDDCGQDESIAIAEQFIKEYQGSVRFRIIYRDKNGGLSAARNTGINEVQGDYLYFLDSDDWIVPECIETMVECLQKYPIAEVVQAGARIEGNDKERIGYLSYMNFEKKRRPEYSDDGEWIARAFLHRQYMNSTAWGKLLKTSFVRGNNLSFADGYIHEDEIFVIDLARTVSHLAICLRNLYVYQLRGSGIMGGVKHNDYAYIQKLLTQMLHRCYGERKETLIQGTYQFGNMFYRAKGFERCSIKHEYRTTMMNIARQSRYPWLKLWTMFPLWLRQKERFYHFARLFIEMNLRMEGQLSNPKVLYKRICQVLRRD